MTMTYKQITATMGALLAYVSLSGAPLTPQQAMDAVTDFQAANSKRLNIKGVGKLSLAYTEESSSGASCFYIFNRQGDAGFIIASADDRLPSVLGFSDSGSYEPGKENDNLRYWLGEYAREISAYLLEDPKVGPYVQKARPIDNPPIAPLCTTKWNQGKPYNDQCPFDSRAHATSVTGCIATAMAQVMKYYNWPEQATGSRNGYIFSNTPLRWSQMIDVYENNHYTSSEAEAVATLMRQCGASVDMQYSAYASGAYENDVQYAWRTYFGYDAGLELNYRDYFTYSEWNQMVYNEISENGPVLYCGRSSQGGHAFVCDGYLGNNFYHFNWGWGGYQDGYFLLNALNPATGGAGSSSGGYNTDQSIITGVKKAGEGTGRIQELAVSTGGFEYNNGSFVIRKAPDGYNEIYNPLAYSITCTFGVKVVPFDGAGEPQYVSSGSKTLGRWVGFDSMTVSMPAMPDGKYKVSPAMRTSYGEWKDVGVPLSMQTFVTMEMKNGRPTYTNDGPAAEAQPKLIAGSPVLTSKLYGYTGQIVRVTVSNVGDGDFTGNLYLTMEDNVDEFGDSYSAENWVSIPSHFSIDCEFTSDYQLVPGEYVFEMFDQKFNYLSHGEIFTVEESDFEELDLDGFRIDDVEPRFVTSSDDGLGMVMRCVNPTRSNYNLSIDVNFLDADNLQQVYTIHGEGVTIERETSLLVNFPMPEFNLQPGSYFIEVKDASGQLLTPVVPLIVVSETREQDGIYYYVTSEKAKTATVVAPPTEDYSGTVTIPAYIDGYAVTTIKSDALTFADAVTRVSVPPTVKILESGSFYMTENLAEFQVRSSEPPLINPDAFNPEVEQNIVLLTPAGAANYYGQQPGWDMFAFSNWTIDLGPGVEIVGGLLENPDTGNYYSPYYVSGDEALEFQVALPQGLFPLAEWSINGGTPVRHGFEGTTITLPVLNGATASLKITADDGSGVETLIDADGRVDVYSIDGVLVVRQADSNALRQLPKGFYIAGGRKIRI